MPSVTLSREWTDPRGHAHPTGAVLAVDDVTAARLQAAGYAGAVGGSADTELATAPLAGVPLWWYPGPDGRDAPPDGTVPDGSSPDGAVP
jgi:hypothetical protein